MNRRYIKLDKYGISQERYRELSAFVMQYQEWKDGLSKQSSTKLSSKVAMVDIAAEKCSQETVGDNGLTEYIIKNVTEERPFYYLKEIMRMPYNDRTFYNARKRFFIILNESKQ